jgi:branched-chain amino acid transport system permease protein
MVELPDFFLQVMWEGFVAGHSLCADCAGVRADLQGLRRVQFCPGHHGGVRRLTLVGLHEKGVPAYLALILTIGVMGVLAYLMERIVMRPLVNQPDIILLMSTIGLTYFLIGLGEFIFGGEPKQMITRSLACRPARRHSRSARRLLILQHIDIAAAVIAIIMVGRAGGVLQQDPDRARLARGGR